MSISKLAQQYQGLNTVQEQQKERLKNHGNLLLFLRLQCFSEKKYIIIKFNKSFSHL